MNQVALKEFVTSLNILTVSTGATTSAWGFLEYWNFVNTSAAGIGVFLTLIFGIIAIMFNLYNSFKLNKVDKNEKDIGDQGERLELHIIETRDSLDEILSKLDKK